MTIYFDENLPPVFAEGFGKLQEPLLKKLGIDTPVAVKSVVAVFGRGLSDEELFDRMRGEPCCYVTQDLNIHNRLHQRVVYQAAGIGVFFIESRKKGTNYWGYVELLVKRWPRILEVCHKETRPFAYLILRRIGRGNKGVRLF